MISLRQVVDTPKIPPEGWSRAVDALQLSAGAEEGVHPKWSKAPLKIPLFLSDFGLHQRRETCAVERSHPLERTPCLPA